MKKNYRTILVVAAHPDDEVLGCGGTIARYAKEGSRVYCLFLGRGKSSRREENDVQTAQAQLEKEAQAAAEILGISKLFFEDFPDQKYDSVSLLDIVHAIEKIKEEVQPDVVFTHHPSDINRDHQIAYQATITACRPGSDQSVRTIYSFVIPAAAEWAHNPFVPDTFFDIKNTLEQKQEAMEAYQSELKAYPHPRSLEALENTARYWGMVCGEAYAEVFTLVRRIS